MIRAHNRFPPVGTFVVGAPGSELASSGNDARGWLSDAATVGGTAPLGCSSDGDPSYCHMDLIESSTDFSPTLNDALRRIVSSVACAQDLAPLETDDPAQLDVTLVAVDGQVSRLLRSSTVGHT